MVTFGSLANAEDIPVEKLQSFVKAFAYFYHYTIIWQLDLSLKYFKTKVLRPLGMKDVPRHIKLHRWIPMKDLLADPKVMLLITHGGANTVLEAIYSGKPILGVALFSDQYYNTQRYVHRGLGEALIATEIDENTLHKALESMLRLNYKM